MAFVINPVENHSTAREKMISAWVFEGIIAAGSIAYHAVLLNTTAYGIDPLIEENIFDIRLVEDFPIQIEMLRIFKVREWTSMESGYSGAFYLRNQVDTRRIVALLDTPEYCWTRTLKQPTRTSPQALKKIPLADSRLTAQTYLRSEYSIEL